MKIQILDLGRASYASALETQRGYLFGDRVLRPSKVGVAVREGEQGERKDGEGESG